MADPQTSQKTPLRVGKLRNGQPGGLLQSGNPGNKGGGRKPAKFYEHCLNAVEDPKLWEAAREKQPLGTLGLAAEYTYGKPQQNIEHSGDITFRVLYDEDTAPDREDA